VAGVLYDTAGKKVRLSAFLYGLTRGSSGETWEVFDRCARPAYLLTTHCLLLTTHYLLLTTHYLLLTKCYLLVTAYSRTHVLLTRARAHTTYQHLLLAAYCSLLPTAYSLLTATCRYGPVLSESDLFAPPPLAFGLTCGDPIVVLEALVPVVASRGPRKQVPPSAPFHFAGLVLGKEPSESARRRWAMVR
jgi:hypothetical protein